jgi:hypothetical protein
MRRINRLSGTSVSIYHSFHTEVAIYRAQRMIKKAQKRQANQ